MRIEKEILVNILKILFVSSLTTGSAGFNEFDGGNMILFQIEVFGRNIKVTTLTRFFIKVTARPSFTRFLGEQMEFSKYQNR